MYGKQKRPTLVRKWDFRKSSEFIDFLLAFTSVEWRLNKGLEPECTVINVSFLSCGKSWHKDTYEGNCCIVQTGASL